MSLTEAFRLAIAVLTGPWQLVVQTTLSFVVIAAGLKLILSWFPGLPLHVSRVFLVLWRSGVRIATKIKRSEDHAQQTKFAPQPRWVKPTWVVWELGTGWVIFGLLTLVALQCLVAAFWPAPGTEPWKPLLAFGLWFALTYYSKRFASQARDAWFLLNTGLWKSYR